MTWSKEVWGYSASMGGLGMYTRMSCFRLDCRWIVSVVSLETVASGVLLVAAVAAVVNCYSQDRFHYSMEMVTHLKGNSCWSLALQTTACHLGWNDRRKRMDGGKNSRGKTVTRSRWDRPLDVGDCHPEEVQKSAIFHTRAKTAWYDKAHS